MIHLIADPEQLKQVASSFGAALTVLAVMGAMVALAAWLGKGYPDDDDFA